MTITRNHKIMLRLRPAIRFIKYRILHMDDCPERIARAVALGLFIAWLPLFGLHMLLVLLAAFVLRANKAIALTVVWISNPLTFIPIYYPCYLLGRYILGIFEDKPKIAPEQMQEYVNKTFSVSHILTHFYTAEFWKQTLDLAMQIGTETLIGGAVIGGFIARLSYLTTYRFISFYKIRKSHRKKRQPET